MNNGDVAGPVEYTLLLLSEYTLEFNTVIE